MACNPFILFANFVIHSFHCAYGQSGKMRRFLAFKNEKGMPKRGRTEPADEVEMLTSGPKGRLICRALRMGEARTFRNQPALSSCGSGSEETF